MSVWYSLVDADGQTVELSEPLTHEGGTYALGGTDTAELNVTYNYATIYGGVYVLTGREYPGMIEMLHGRSAAESIADLEGLAAVLPDEPDDDYWAATPGNAGHAVALLLKMAREHPTATWEAHG